jgi:hypothetical protein
MNVCETWADGGREQRQLSWGHNVVLFVMIWEYIWFAKNN